LSIPKVAAVTAAVFLGSIGDPRAYDAGAQIVRVAGLSLVERSSGVLHGTKRISKRGRGRCSGPRPTCSPSAVSPQAVSSAPTMRPCARATAGRSSTRSSP